MPPFSRPDGPAMDDEVPILLVHHWRARLCLAESSMEESLGGTASQRHLLSRSGSLEDTLENTPAPVGEHVLPTVAPPSPRAPVLSSSSAVEPAPPEAAPSVPTHADDTYTIVPWFLSSGDVAAPSPDDPCAQWLWCWCARLHTRCCEAYIWCAQLCAHCVCAITLGRLRCIAFRHGQVCPARLGCRHARMMRAAAAQARAHSHQLVLQHRPVGTRHGGWWYWPDVAGAFCGLARLSQFNAHETRGRSRASCRAWVAAPMRV